MTTPHTPQRYRLEVHSDIGDGYLDRAWPHADIADLLADATARAQEIEQWKANSKENKLIAEENHRRAEAAEARCAVLTQEQEQLIELFDKILLQPPDADDMEWARRELAALRAPLAK